MVLQNVELWGGLAIVAFIFGFIIAFCWGCYKTNKLPHTVKNEIEKFRDSPNPLIYLKQFLNIPKYCTPYAGCSSSWSVDGLRKHGNQLTWCEESWRDCNAYQDCVHGKCIPKPNL